MDRNEIIEITNSFTKINYSQMTKSCTILPFIIIHQLHDTSDLSSYKL